MASIQLTLNFLLVLHDMFPFYCVIFLWNLQLLLNFTKMHNVQIYISLDLVHLVTSLGPKTDLIQS